MNNMDLKGVGHVWKKTLLIIGGVFFVFLLLFAGILVFGASYNDKVLPGVRVGGVLVGGMEETELRDFLRNMSDKLVNEGFQFSFVKENGSTESFILEPVFVADGEVVRELAYIDIDEATINLLRYGKEGNMVQQSFTTISALFSRPTVLLSGVRVDGDAIRSIIIDRLEPHAVAPKNSTVVITSQSPLVYTITTSTPGSIFITDNIVDTLYESWASLLAPEIAIERIDKEADVIREDVLSLVGLLPRVVEAGSLSFAYTNPRTRQEYTWNVQPSLLTSWIVVKEHNGQFVFGLRTASTTEHLDAILSSIVNEKAKDAKFEIDGETGKVTKFQGSRPGTMVDIEATYEALENAFIERTLHDEGFTTVVQIVVKQVDPSISTAEVNDLGITEVLGVGVSDYSRSPLNRILNITNAVNKLNGVIIQPGEEFSTIEYTKPYTLAGGYYPELVIKGDELKPEVAGGLCQIGTTLFRMAMNSGMEITQRRNHSLVVFHYNDPVNGLPGTDATIYDPAPDFRFKNDTGHAILIQTEMDKEAEDLIFTIWGTSDGRKASYTHPKVLNWIPAPAPITIETTKLEPGKRSCQGSFRGANAAFTYTVERANGTVDERVFESHYRPLAQVCLVGVEPKVEGEDVLSGESSSSTPLESL